MNLLQMHDIDKHYGGPPVVQNVSLEIQEGETVAVIGPNGAGKTTLFSVMAGERRADRGRVELLGRDVTRAGAQRLAHLGVARTFQIARYFPTMTVEQNVTVAALSHRRGYRRWWSGTPRADESAARSMEAVGLTDLRGVQASALSQGNRKNLEIAMALVQEPRLLLLDEPTAGMGAEDLPRTVDVLRRLREARPELTIVITAHDMEVVFALADRVVLMAAGRVALDGEPSMVRDHPKTREIYLGGSVEGGLT